MRVEHIGIAVRNADTWKKMYEELFPDVTFKEEVIPSQKVKVTFVMTENLKIELLEPTDETSTVAKFLEKRGEGFHHIAYETEDLLKTMEAYKDQGYRFLYEEPDTGAEGFLVNFLAPGMTKKVLTEFCEDPVR